MYLRRSLREASTRLLASQHLHEDHPETEHVTWQPILLGEQYLGRHKLRRSRAEVLQGQQQHRMTRVARGGNRSAELRSARVAMCFLYELKNGPLRFVIYKQRVGVVLARRMQYIARGSHFMSCTDGCPTSNRCPTTALQ